MEPSVIDDLIKEYSSARQVYDYEFLKTYYRGDDGYVIVAKTVSAKIPMLFMHTDTNYSISMMLAFFKAVKLHKQLFFTAPSMYLQSRIKKTFDIVEQDNFILIKTRSF